MIRPGLQYEIFDLQNLLEHADYRWDSEYLCFHFHKNPNLRYVSIGDILSSSQYGISIKMNVDGVGTKIYRMNEISRLLADPHPSKSALLDAQQLKVYRLNDRDVLFNRTNSHDFVGRTAVFRKTLDEDVAFASYLVRLTPNDLVTPEYLTTYLNTKYGILDVKRRARISINQANVNPEELKKAEIPVLSDYLQQTITRLFDESFAFINMSRNNYSDAEAILMDELDLVDWRPQIQNQTVRQYVESVDLGRMDAEYYQSHDEQMIRIIKHYDNGWDVAGNLFYIKDRNVIPDEFTEYKYVEISNVGENGEISNCDVDFGLSLPNRARRFVSQGDVIVSSVDGSFGSVAVIDEEYDGAICSTGFYVVESDSLNPETILVMMKSIAGQLQLRKGSSGTINASIKKDQFSRIILPRIKSGAQSMIKRKIIEVYDLRRQSKNLLEDCKRAVELAIERDESAAIQFLINSNEIRTARVCRS